MRLLPILCFDTPLYFICSSWMIIFDFMRILEEREFEFQFFLFPCFSHIRHFFMRFSVGSVVFVSGAKKGRAWDKQGFMVRILPAMKWKCGDCRLNGLLQRPFCPWKPGTTFAADNEQPIPTWYTGISGGCADREAGRKQKMQSSKTVFYHKNRIHGKQKAAPTDGFMKIIWRRFFFLTMFAAGYSSCTTRILYEIFVKKMKYAKSFAITYHSIV